LGPASVLSRTDGQGENLARSGVGEMIIYVESPEESKGIPNGGFECKSPLYARDFSIFATVIPSISVKNEKRGR